MATEYTRCLDCMSMSDEDARSHAKIQEMYENFAYRMTLSEQYTFLGLTGILAYAESLKRRLHKLAEKHAPYDAESRQRLFDLRVNEGLSFEQIARKMNAEGFRLKNGRQWTRGAVKLFWRRLREYKQLIDEIDINHMREVLEENQRLVKGHKALMDMFQKLEEAENKKVVLGSRALHIGCNVEPANRSNGAAATSPFDT